MTLSRRRQISFISRMIIILIAVVYALFPVLWIFSASLDPTSTLGRQGLLPTNLSLRHYQELLNDPLNPFLLWLWNSIKIATISTVLALFITTLSAYAFSRFRFRGRRNLLLTILLIQVFPNLLAMVALYLLLQQVGAYIPSLGLNSHGGLIMVYMGGVMGINVWLMKGFFDSIPREIDESAQVDGATPWQTFWYLILPLVRPILVVVGILTFIGTYSDFILASILIQDTELFTLMVGLNLFVSQNFAQEWGKFSAGALMGAVPIVIVYLLLQDQIVGGLTQGSVKG
jgi:ABC-type maltose transport system permease subunit